MWEADREPDRDEKREREEGEEAVLRHSPALIGRDLSSYVQCDDGDVPTQTYNTFTRQVGMFF